MRTLLSHGADPAKPLHDGTTALDKAHQYAHAEVAATLVEARERRALQESSAEWGAAMRSGTDAMAQLRLGGDELVSEPTP